MTTLAKLLTDLRKQTTDLDQRLDSLKARRHALAKAWIPRKEVVERLSAKIDEAAASYGKRLESMAGTAANPDRMPGMVDHPLSGSRPGDHFDRDSLCFYFGDQMKEAMADRVMRMPWRGAEPGDDEGLPADGRGEELDRLDAEIEELQAQRQTLRDELATVTGD